tara:strand:- start:730 stop:1110 length:381 start_codon:yes stop_codon:yes gene_type:complete
MASKVRIGTSVQPLEQVSSGDPFYIDSDFGKRSSVNFEYTPSGQTFNNSTVLCSNSSSTSIASNIEFIGVKHMSGAAAYISLDGGTTNHIYIPVGSSVSLIVVEGTNVHVKGSSSSKTKLTVTTGT